MDRFFVTMRDDDLLEGEVEHRSESRQFPLHVPCPAVPHSELSPSLCEGVPEDYHPVLWEPHRRLKTSPAVKEGDQAAGEPHVRDDRFQSGLRDVVREEEHGAEGADPVSPDEQVDVADVVWHQDHGYGRGTPIKPLPEADAVERRSEGIEDETLAT